MEDPPFSILSKNEAMNINMATITAMFEKMNPLTLPKLHATKSTIVWNTVPIIIPPVLSLIIPSITPIKGAKNRAVNMVKTENLTTPVNGFIETKR